MSEPRDDAPTEVLSITRTSRPGGTSVVILSGEIDYDGGSRLEEALLASLEPAGRVVVDFSRVSFMDSTGIRALLRTHQAATAYPGGWIRLAAPTPAVHRVLTIVGIESVITVHPSVDEALEY